jgi:hypothetical protein
VLGIRTDAIYVNTLVGFLSLFSNIGLQSHSTPCMVGKSKNWLMYNNVTYRSMQFVTQIMLINYCFHFFLRSCPLF